MGREGAFPITWVTAVDPEEPLYVGKLLICILAKDEYSKTEPADGDLTGAPVTKDGVTTDDTDNVKPAHNRLSGSRNLAGNGISHRHDGASHAVHHLHRRNTITDALKGTDGVTVLSIGNEKS